MMPLKNCWEIKKCGREQGGARADELGVCPAYPNRGHSCWSVTGTLCGGEVQGTFAQKEMDCLQCETYKRYNIRSGTEKLQLVSECVPEMMLYLKDAAKHPAGQASEQLLDALTDSIEQTLEEKTQAQTRELIEANHRLREREEELRTQNMRFKTALDNMCEGLCMFDADMRLVVCNERYANMYQLPPQLLQVGTPHEAIIEHRVRTGILTGGKSDHAVDEKLKTLGELPAAATSSRIDELADGRFICVTRQPMDGGGWVATHRDVTEQRRSEATMAHMAHHDALTDLANRVQLRDHIEKNWGYVRRGETLAVLGSGPRPFQDHQRHSGPSGRRRLAVRGFRTLARMRARHRFGGAHGRRRVLDRAGRGRAAGWRFHPGGAPCRRDQRSVRSRRTPRCHWHQRRNCGGARRWCRVRISC